MKSRAVRFNTSSKIQEFQEVGKTGVVRGGTTPRTRFVEAMSKILSSEKKRIRGV